MSTNENRKPREFEVYGRNLNSYPSWDICESPPVTDELIRLREVLTPEVDPRAAGVEWVMENVFKYGGSCGLDHATAIKREAIRAGILK
jgi:hypothetical protein